MDRPQQPGQHTSRQTRKLPEAISLLKTTLQLKPDSAEAHNNLGSAYTRMKDRTLDSVRSTRWLCNCVRSFRRRKTIWGARWYKLPGRTNEAIGHFRQAIELKPDFATLTTTSVRRFSNSQEGRATRSSNTKSLWSWIPLR